MMQHIFIRELKVETVIGIQAWERQVKQLLCIDIEFSYDMSGALSADKVEFAIDYITVTEAITTFTQNNHFHLLETLANQLANLLLTTFPIQWLRLTVAKPGALSQAKTVGVSIELTNTNL